MSVLVNYNRRPEDVPEEVAKTFLAIVEISGKSIMTLYNWLSLLKLSEEIRTEMLSLAELQSPQRREMQDKLSAKQERTSFCRQFTPLQGRSKFTRRGAGWSSCPVKKSQ